MNAGPVDATADVAVIGAGIVGLAVAREVLIRHPDRRVVVFDKEPELAAHASGRNSGVLHAGFYYSPDSLKARLTRRGNEMLHEFCGEHAVPVRRCGKVVVTRDPVELPVLSALYERGLANGVPLELVDERQLRDLEPLARTVEAALWSPTTSVADPVAVVRAVAADVERRGGEIRLADAVQSAEPRVVQTSAEKWSVGHVVNCAGLQADLVARWFGMCDDYLVIPFKGVYRQGNWEQGRLTRHVYPVPDPANPFLGVHVTVTVTGGVKIGPTASPVLSRENYRRLDGVRRGEIVEALTGLTGFVRRDPEGTVRLIADEVRKHSARALAADAAGLVPSIRPRDFTRSGRPGIRAQLVHRETGVLEMDFVVRGDARSTHVLNAVSPAWTSALAVAEHVVAGMGRTR